MLALSAIGYRGCELNLSLPRNRKRVADEISRCLTSFTPVQGKWTLLWGPAGYRPGIAGLDTSAMYVAGSKSSPSTIAVLVRGTNFFSLQDWASNLMIAPRVWSYGSSGADARVSASVWLGLKILQTLKADPFSSPPPETELEKIQADVALVQARLEYAVLERILAGDMSYDAVGLIAGIMNQLPHLATAVPAAFPDEVALLSKMTQAQSVAPGATTLFEFLKHFVSKASEQVNIHIVGHSKGGALSPALALWLADTQGNQAGPDGWDPGGGARLHVHTFAAPTPGNRAFANHFQQKLNAGYRLANPYDIVPHVWEPSEINQIPDLYGSQLHELKVPAHTLAKLLQPLDYQHECVAEPWPAGPLTARPLPLQITFNHLDAYLTRLCIFDAKTLSFLALFAPLSR
jgi:hypothetical protein